MQTLHAVYHRKNLDQQGGVYKYPVSNEGVFEDFDEAQAKADSITATGEWATVDRYYRYTKEEWRKNQYKYKDNSGKRMTMVNEKDGLSHITEGLHFDIV